MNERAKYIIEQRKAGSTFREIGQSIGISTSAAREAWIRAVAAYNAGGISVRACNALAREFGPEISSSMLTSKTREEILAIPGIGRGCLEEIERWLEEEGGLAPTIKRCPRCGQEVKA